MEQELIEHEEVSKLEEVRSEISFHVQELHEENDYNEIQIAGDGELSLSRDALNEGIAETMLHESQQIAHDVSREGIRILLLDERNAHANYMKDNLKEMQTYYENILELQLKPSVYQEEQLYAQMQMQLNNTETMINKLKTALQYIERKYSNMQDQKKRLQQNYDARQKTFKASLDRKIYLLNKQNERMDLLKNQTDLSQCLERVMQLEDSLMLKLEQKNVKSGRKDEIKQLEDKTALQQKELDDVSVKRNEVFLELTTLNTELERVKDSKIKLLNKQVDLREVMIMGDNHKMRITTLQQEINLLKKSIHNKENSRTDLPALRGTLIEVEKQNETLRAHNQGIQEKTESIHEMLQTLQKLKEDSYSNSAQQLQQEKTLLVETANLTSLESKRQIIHKQLEEEVKLSDELQLSTKNCKEKLTQTKQQFETEMFELTECLNEHNKNYDKNSAYKVMLVNRKESDRNNNEQQIKLKLVEVDNIKTEIEEVKVELDKTLEVVETSARLKEKLAKDKASAEDEYNTKYFSIFGVNSSLNDVRGILKSPKKVTFQGLSSEMSSETPSQDNSVASKEATVSLFDLVRHRYPASQQSQNKPKKYRLDSPERDIS